MFVQGRIIKVTDLIVWVLLAFLFGVVVGEGLGFLIWGLK